VHLATPNLKLVSQMCSNTDLIQQACSSIVALKIKISKQTKHSTSHTPINMASITLENVEVPATPYAMFSYIKLPKGVMKPVLSLSSSLMGMFQYSTLCPAA